MLLNLFLVEICSSNSNSQKEKLNFANFEFINSYSKQLYQHINAEKKTANEILNQFETETETAIFTTSIPVISIHALMLICYAAGIIFLIFTICMFVYAIYQCKQHNYQEI